MGEARQKSRSLQALLRAEPRCVYCEAAATTIEHMPPRVLFLKRHRPSGMEFAACRECNHGTKGADAVAALFSRLSQADEDVFWQSPEGITLRFTMERDAPGVREEVFGDPRGGPQWIRSRSGILTRKIVIQADGPLVKAYLDVFAAKIGMALYRQHVGAPLPIGGGVQTLWYLNAGLSEEHAYTHLSILPINGGLKQGKFTASEQFAYRYNCDEKSILAALVGLNSNLHLFVIATSQPETYGLPHQIPGSARAGNFVRPGELTGIIGRCTVGPREGVVSNHP